MIKIRIKVGHILKSDCEVNNDLKYKTPLCLDRICNWDKWKYQGLVNVWHSFQTWLKPRNFKGIINQS